MPVAALMRELEIDPAAMRAAELTRMKVVNRWFAIYKIIEAAFVGAGTTAYGFGARYRNDFARGFGLGLALQGGLMLVLDLIAESRAFTYTDQLRNLRVAWASDSSDVGYRPGASAAGNKLWVSVTVAF